MGIREEKKGIRNVHKVKFTWTIPDYDITVRYTNKIEAGGNYIIKTLMEPVYANGTVVGSNPHIMIEKVDKRYRPSKEMKYVIKTKNNMAFLATFGCQKLKFQHKYSGRNLFIENINVHRYLEDLKDLVLNYEILMFDCGYQESSSFNDSIYLEDAKNLLNDKVYSDFEIYANDDVIKGHKFVISSRAPALAKMLEESGSKIVIKDHSTESVNEFLRYLYCEQMCYKKESIIFEVLSLAHIYEVEYLKQHCETILTEILNLSNANLIFQKAHKYQLNENLIHSSFGLVQELFKSINQKLPDEFINDPAYVDNLITIAENLINGLKKKEKANADDAFIMASNSEKNLSIEKAIDDIYKEAESLEHVASDIDDYHQINESDPTEEIIESIQRLIEHANDDQENGFKEDDADVLVEEIILEDNAIQCANPLKYFDESVLETIEESPFEVDIPQYDDECVFTVTDDDKAILEQIMRDHGNIFAKKSQDIDDISEDENDNEIIFGQTFVENDNKNASDSDNADSLIDFTENLEFVVEISQNEYDAEETSNINDDVQIHSIIKEEIVRIIDVEKMEAADKNESQESTSISTKENFALNSSNEENPAHFKEDALKESVDNDVERKNI